MASRPGMRRTSANHPGLRDVTPAGSTRHVLEGWRQSCVVTHRLFRTATCRFPAGGWGTPKCRRRARIRPPRRRHHQHTVVGRCPSFPATGSVRRGGFASWGKARQRRFVAYDTLATAFVVQLDWSSARVHVVKRGDTLTARLAEAPLVLGREDLGHVIVSTRPRWTTAESTRRSSSESAGSRRSGTEALSPPVGQVSRRRAGGARPPACPSTLGRADPRGDHPPG